jgi:hypothetical protein
MQHLEPSTAAPWHTVGSILAIHETDLLQYDATAYDPTVMTVRCNWNAITQYPSILLHVPKWTS